MNNGWDSLTPNRKRIARAAQAAVLLWTNGEEERAGVVMDKARALYESWEDLFLTLCVWTDMALECDPGNPFEGVKFINAETGEEGTADDVPPEVAWAGRFYAARAADDFEMAEALFRAMLKEEATFQTEATLSVLRGAVLRRQKEGMHG